VRHRSKSCVRAWLAAVMYDGAAEGVMRTRGALRKSYLPTYQMRVNVQSWSLSLCLT